MAQDFKRWADPAVSTATPTIDILRFVVSSAATGRSRAGRLTNLMVNDVARAYFNTHSLTPICVVKCEEDFGPGGKRKCGESRESMYDTKAAPLNWQQCYTELLERNGFAGTHESTGTTRHAERD